MSTSNALHRVIVVGSGKGGVGKNLYVAAMLEYLQQRRRSGIIARSTIDP